MSGTDFSMSLDVFNNIEGAKETFERNYLNAGVYDLEITGVKFDKTRKGVQFFAVDFVVRGSNCDKHKIGDHVNWFTGADKDGFLGNVKNFSRAALYVDQEISADSITKEVIAELIRDGGELVRGKRVTCSVTLVPTKPSPSQPQGGTYSRHVFAPPGAKAA